LCKYGWIYGLWRSSHQIGTALGLWEGDELSNILFSRQQSTQTVDAEGEAAMRRCSVFEGIEKESKTRSSGLLGDSEHLEDL
jgi:hypothetical protein